MPSVFVTERKPALLRSKTIPPASFNRLIERPRILELLAPGKAARINLVHGPAGFGKTTVLRQAFTARAASKPVWLTLDDADNDPGRLLFHLLGAIGRPADRTAAGAFENIGVATDYFLDLQEALGAMPAEFCLFLDDLEVIREPAALEALRGVIQAIPPDATIILGSRTYPELPLARLRMHGMLQEIDANTLRFSRQEIDEVLRKELPEVSLEPGTAARLLEVTEGWIGSIQMAVSALKSAQGKEELFAQFTGSNTELAQYLAEDLLARQPRKIKEFLLSTSVLEQLCGSLCNALLERAGSAELLQELVRSNLFLFSLDQQGSWYRYHNLFRDFLLSRAQALGENRLNELRKRAALWFSAQGRPATAISYALASGDFHLGAELIEQSIMPFFFAGRLITIAEWVRALPHEIRDRSPRIMLAYAWALLALQQKPDLVTALLSDLEKRTDLDGDLRNEVLYLGPFQRALRDDLEELDTFCERVAASPNVSDFARGVLWNITAYVRIRKRDMQEAERAAREARAAHLRSGSAYGLVFAEYFSGVIELERGRVQSACSIRDSIMSLVRNSQNETAPGAVAAALNIRLLYERNQVEELSEQLDRFGQPILKIGTHQEVIEVLEIQAHLAFSSDNYGEACRILNEMRQQGRARGHPRMVATGWALQSQMAARRGDTSAATDYLSQASECETLARYSGELLATTRARDAIAEGRLGLARAVLDSAIARAEAKGCGLSAYELRLLRLEVRQLSGETGRLEPDLRNVLDFIARERALRAVLQAPAFVRAEIVSYARRNRRCTGDPILDQIDPEKKAEAESAPLKETPGLEPLSTREIEVLELVSRGLNNQSISDNLCISLPTVKTHLRNINAKLLATNRTEAVAIARRHHIIK